jgi:hypothetical protein
MGMAVQYTPEGIRYELPHRQSHKPLKQTEYSTPPSVLNSPSLAPVNSQSVLRTTPRPAATLQTAIDALRIFPAAFELLVQLYEDWLTLAEDLKEKLSKANATNSIKQDETSRNIEILNAACSAIKALRGPGKGYCPSLLSMSDIAGLAKGKSDVVDEEALVNAGRIILSVQEVRPF